MSEENKELIESGKEQDNGNNAYIEAINEMKKNYVPKEKLQKVQEENKQLLDALVSGKQIDLPEQKEVKPSVDDMRNKLYNGKDGELSNLEYIKTSLELRSALIEAGERDPFLPVGDQVTLTAEHYEKASQVAELLQDCVDFADGDSGIFTAEYQRRVKDASIPIPKGKTRR